jgi:putative ABC transport system ATP-binding protein
MVTSEMSDLVVDARNLFKRYGTGDGVRAALDGVTLSVEKGEFACVLGHSGCGKSTLLGILGCLDQSYEGELKLFGRDARKMSDDQQAALRGRKIGFVFQAFHLMGHLSVRDNVLASTLFLRGESDMAALHNRADELLEQVGLLDRAKDTPSTLSGGERQRVAIARALLMKPALLLCDEPTGNLDMETGKNIVRLFRELHEDSGITVIAVTHETQLADAADRVIRLKAGKIVEDVEAA